MTTILLEQMRQHLRKKSHSAKPIVIIGNRGLTEAVHLEIERALLAHELVKIRVNAENRESRSEMINTICNTHDAHLIQAVGHVAVIYREKEED